MFSNSWQQPGGHAPTHTHNDRTDIRDRVKAYSMVEDAANSQPATASATLSPTSAFFDPPSRFPNQHGTIFRVPKRRYPQQEAEKPRKRQQQLQPPPQRDCLDDIQPKGSPLAENLISELTQTVFQSVTRQGTNPSQASIQARSRLRVPLSTAAL